MDHHPLLCALSLWPLCAQVDAPRAEKPAVPPVELVEREGVTPLHRVGHLWLAGQPGEEALERLVLEDGVRTVLDLRRPTEARGFDEPAAAERLGAEYIPLGFGAPEELEDALFASARRVLRAAENAPVLLHCASSNRVGAVWVAARVLDEGVPWERALEEARRVGLRSSDLEERARIYVQGGGSRELGLVTEDLRKRFPGVPRTSIAQLRSDLRGEQPPLLLDARSAEEYAHSHLSGALRSDTPEARAALEQAADEARPVVVYCSVGWRSAEHVRALLEQGHTAVSNLEGSIFAWANAGYPLHRGAERVTTVHPYDAKWGRLLAPERRAALPADGK